ncbi:MAG: hypothetical protein ACI4GA_06600 [Acutalibacteraceae bacterium]|nr:hypothetical protein [Oscillospiraceae bacterium]
MAIKTAIKNKTEDRGRSNELICPKCHQLTSMQLYSNYDLNNYLSLLLGKTDDFNFAVCPKCAAVFRLSDTFVPDSGQRLSEYHLIPTDKKHE